MTPTIEEANDGREYSYKEARRKFIIKQCPDENTALITLLLGIPIAIGSCLLSPTDCSVKEDITNIYIGDAVYKAPENQASQQQNSFSITFDISGQQTHIQRSIQTTGHYEASGQPVRQHDNAINVDEDGTVNGTDILVPAMTFKIDYTVDPSFVTQSYYNTLSQLVGKTNNGSYMGFDTCELLLTSVSGSRRDTDNWDLQYGFAVSKNQNSLSIGDISGITKAGWEYLWVYYTSKASDDGKSMRKYASAAYTEQVYQTGNFASLGLP